MNINDLLTEMAQRPLDAAHGLPQLSEEQLNAHPSGHPNSIAWLLWHAGREVDIQLSALNGEPEAWENYRARFALGPLGESMGFGHSAEQARQIKVADQSLLVEYLDTALSALISYTAALSAAQLDEVVDQAWDPAVTRGVRLVSIIDDAAMHLGQAAYAAGAVENLTARVS